MILTTQAQTQIIRIKLQTMANDSIQSTQKTRKKVPGPLHKESAGDSPLLLCASNPSIPRRQLPTAGPEKQYTFNPGI